MAKSRYVKDSMRSDNWFTDLTVSEKLLFTYLLSNDKVGLCGVYELPIKKIQWETGIDSWTITKAFERFESVWKVCYRDWRVMIVNFLRNQSMNDNMVKWAKREAEKIGKEVWLSFLNFKGFERLSNDFKSFDILNFTLLNFTLPNLSDNQQSWNLLKPIEKEVKPPSTIKIDIDNLIEQIKLKVEEMWLAYDKKDERNFWKHILTAKEFWAFCDKLKMDRVKFTLAVLEASVKISFWRWPATWPMKIYQRYSEIYNQTAQKSQSKSNVLVI